MKKIIFIIAIFAILFIFFIFVLSNNSADKRKTIKFSSWGSQSEVIILKKLISEYEEKNPDINIEFIHIPQNYFQKIQLLFASNLQPDVIFFNNQNIQMYIKAGLLEDLTPYINKNKFFPQAIECFENNNKIYAVPRDISTLILYYNKNILKNKNINLYTDLKSINDLKNISIKLKSKENFGINFEEDSLYWSYFLASNGGGIISDDKKSIIINKKESIEALKIYSDLINKYNAAPTKAQIGSMTSAQMFINGQLAMYLGGRWMVPKFREAINFEWDTAEFPSGNNKLYIDASGWAVSAKSRNKQEAVKFIQYLSSEQTLTKLAQTGLIIPAAINSAKQIIKEDKTKYPEHSYLFTDMIYNTKPTPINENYSAINDIIKEKSQSIFNGHLSPEKAFDEKTIKKLESLL